MVKSDEPVGHAAIESPALNEGSWLGALDSQPRVREFDLHDLCREPADPDA